MQGKKHQHPRPRRGRGGGVFGPHQRAMYSGGTEVAGLVSIADRLRCVSGLHERSSGDRGDLGGWHDGTALPLVMSPQLRAGHDSRGERADHSAGVLQLRAGLWVPPPPGPRCAPGPSPASLHLSGAADAAAAPSPGPALRIRMVWRRPAASEDHGCGTAGCTAAATVLCFNRWWYLHWAGAGAGMACNAAAEVAELRGSQAVLVTVLEWCDLNSLGHVQRRRSARLAGGPLDFDQSYVRCRPPSGAAPDRLPWNRPRSCL